MVTQNPNLISPAAMKSMQSTSGSSEPLLSEVLTKVNNAKDKPKKISVLKENDSPHLRMVLKAAFDPKIEWDLPKGTPPFIPNEVPIGTEHSMLRSESKKLWHFIKGADTETPKINKEKMFLQILEGLHIDEANVLLNAKDKVLNKKYKGLTESAVKEAFGWDDNFVKVEAKGPSYPV